MRKALATIGTGPFRELLALSLPTFARYAELHGYDVVIGTGDEAGGRPQSWGKIPLLLRLLENYDFVVWMDCDVLILDAGVDLETIVPPDAFQAFAVAMREPAKGDCPLMGVWALRAGPRAKRFLAEVWKQEDLVSHRLWEQAAAMRLLGWTTELPFMKNGPSEWDDGSFVLPEEWNMVPLHPIGYAPGKIRHYPAWTVRRRKFDMGTDLAGLRGDRLRYWLGLAERRWRPLYRPIIGELRNRLRPVEPSGQRSKFDQRATGATTDEVSSGSVTGTRRLSPARDSCRQMSLRTWRRSKQK